MYAKVANNGFLVIGKAHYKDVVRNMIKGSAFATHNYTVFYDIDEWLAYAKDQIDFKNRTLKATKFTFYVPKTVIYPDIRIPKTTPDCGRRNLYIRDKGICGYCLKSLCFRNATKDHIYPVSRGGKDEWENVVLSCKECNQKKNNILLKNTGMVLKTRVYRPTWYDLLLLNYNG